MNTFKHGGAQGDIIYALPTIISFGGGKLYLRKYIQYINLKSILSIQPCIKEVIPGGWLDDHIDLSQYRQIAIRAYKRKLKKHLVECHLEIFNKEFDLSNKWLFNIQPKYEAPIVVNRSLKYHDRREINFSVLEKYRRSVIFIGHKDEYNKIRRVYGLTIEKFECKDILEMAQIIKGSKLFIGNQSLGFALAESMKVKRVLEICYEKDNCRPYGEGGHISLTKKLIEESL